MRRLVLVRHATTRWNEEGRLVGASDPPLSPRGRKDARRLRARISRALGPDLLDPSFCGESGRGRCVWTSDLRRTLETAHLAFPRLPLCRDPRLREYDFGLFEGGTFEENRLRHGGTFLRWVDDPVRYPPPGGESLQAFRRRVARWLEEVRRVPEAVAVVHGGVIRMVLALLLDAPFSDVRTPRVEPAGALHLQRAVGRWSVATVGPGVPAGSGPVPLCRYCVHLEGEIDVGST